MMSEKVLKWGSIGIAIILLVLVALSGWILSKNPSSDIVTQLAFLLTAVTLAATTLVGLLQIHWSVKLSQVGGPSRADTEYQSGNGGTSPITIIGHDSKPVSVKVTRDCVTVNVGDGPRDAGSLDRPDERLLLAPIEDVPA